MAAGLSGGRHAAAKESDVGVMFDGSFATEHAEDTEENHATSFGVFGVFSGGFFGSLEVG